MADRNDNGKFAEGNSAAVGHGRPRRAVELTYLRALADVVTVEDWKKIVEKARADAVAGDAKAREWIASYLLGRTPLSLFELAKMEALGINEGHAIAAEAQYEAKGLTAAWDLDLSTPVSRALAVAREAGQLHALAEAKRRGLKLPAGVE